MKFETLSINLKVNLPILKYARKIINSVGSVSFFSPIRPTFRSKMNLHWLGSPLMKVNWSQNETFNSQKATLNLYKCEDEKAEPLLQNNRYYRFEYVTPFSSEECLKLTTLAFGRPLSQSQKYLFDILAIFLPTTRITRTKWAQQSEKNCSVRAFNNKITHSNRWVKKTGDEVV